MSFSPDGDYSISLADAAVITSNYRAANPGARLGGFIGKDAIQAILDQTDCVGIRMYFAEEGGQPTLVLCGAKADENDISTGNLAEGMIPAPPRGSSPNPLNS